MKYAVGLQFTNEAFVDCIIENKEHVSEVYFSWGDFPNGRSSQLQNELYTPWELQSLQMDVLRKLSEHGIAFNLLFNANCYGKDSQSRVFFEKIGMTIDYINENYGLSSVTTTSPLIAKFIKNNFNDVISYGANIVRKFVLCKYLVRKFVLKLKFLEKTLGLHSSQGKSN